MATAKINVCVDEGTKQAVEMLLDEMGLNMTVSNQYVSQKNIDGAGYSL